MISIFSFAALLVGSFLYFNEMGAKRVLIYWSLFLGAFVGLAFLPPIVVTIIQGFVVGWFYVHARLANLT